MPSKYQYIIDAGHGGMKNGKYTTAPAKMFTFPDGYTIYEGVINRKIAGKLITMLLGVGVRFKTVYDHEADTALSARVEHADVIYARDKSSMFLSIHSNAGGGSGFEIWTSKGQTKSDKIANVFAEVYKKHFPNRPFREDRADGDADKEEDFYVLRKTDAPAVLFENLFMDNRKEAEYLNSDIGQEAIARCIFEGIQRIEKLKPV